MQLLRLEMGIDLSYCDIRMPKQLLHFVQGYTILNQPACEGVQKAVEMKNPNRFWLGFCPTRRVP
jgi:hypothetical protein